MTKNRDELFLKQVSDILKTARQNVKTAVNLAMVYFKHNIPHKILKSTIDCIKVKKALENA